MVEYGAEEGGLAEAVLEIGRREPGEREEAAEAIVVGGKKSHRLRRDRHRRVAIETYPPLPVLHVFPVVAEWRVSIVGNRPAMLSSARCAAAAAPTSGGSWTILPRCS